MAHNVRGSEVLSAGGTRIASYQLANAVHHHTLNALQRPPALNRGIKMCNLRNSYELPVILTEPVFGNNAVDASLLSTRRSHCAKAIVLGFMDFQNQKKLPQAQRVLPPEITDLPEHITS